MSVINFGSCCIDHVYQVPRFVAPGETLPSLGYAVHPGGKGLNQSIALAAGGASVRLAGKVGEDGRWLTELLEARGVDTSLMMYSDQPSGHAIIQVSPEGENAIVLHGGSNREITRKDVDAVLETASSGEFLLIQNEISELDYLINQAARAGLRIVFNAAPMTDNVHSMPLQFLEILIINELEGSALTRETEPGLIIAALLARFPDMKIVLTLGEQGAWYADNQQQIKQAALPVKAVDTTGAGDTFTGFFLAAYSQGESVRNSLSLGVRAAAVCVTRPGAASSIPLLADCGTWRDGA